LGSRCIHYQRRRGEGFLVRALPLAMGDPLNCGTMKNPGTIELSDGQTLLVLVQHGRVMEYTWDMGLPHVEFVKRRVGNLPEGAWVGTVSKIDGQVVAISSKHFFGYQLPAPEPVTSAVRELFK
jgi:hypothetical protein